MNIGDLLRSVGLERYVKAFTDNEVDVGTSELPLLRVLVLPASISGVRAT
jgi:hypothetical protein